MSEESKLTPEQHQLVSYILTQGIVSERERMKQLVEEVSTDSIDKQDILKMIDGE